jgi:hypothetical protein
VLLPPVLFSVSVAALIVFDVVDVVVVTGAVTVNVEAVMPTVPVVLPMAVLAVPVVLMLVVPITVRSSVISTAPPASLITPAVEMFSPGDVSENVPVALPMSVEAVPVVLIVVVPVMPVTPVTVV